LDTGFKPQFIIMMKVHANKLRLSSLKYLKAEAQKTRWKFHPYILRRLYTRQIRINQVKKAVREGEIIEYHTLRGSRRVLIRDSIGICVVVDLDTRCVVTAFKNDPSNTHKYINEKPYLFGV